MPVFNGTATLHQSMTSILRQSVPDLELVVVDDGSSDDSAAIADRLAQTDDRVRLKRRSQSGGPAAARNTGIATAKGRYLAFCDADDMWLPHKLERQIACAERTGAPLIYSSYHRIAPDYHASAADFEPEGRVVSVPTKLTHDDLLAGNQIGNLTAMVNLEVTGDVTMPDRPGAEDWALWLSITREHGAAHGVHEPLALYRAEQEGSHSDDRLRAIRAVWRVLREQEGVPRLKAAWYLTRSSVAALKKSKI
ncbi:glycosyltransferase family 2 protein [Dermabacter sp. HSID17554]|uniref:glycosyltransferase family 2 protein n=1 Tax=Dermabacter sp. HSID17554 TaxID=2419511 RepID=UPI000F875021|nr:glycosyltransferase family 2 protein [Dermabacter sp. HSID17554]RUP86861.1 glycosyltransferase [Dermabacter sp. HSID17554]